MIRRIIIGILVGSILAIILIIQNQTRLTKKGVGVKVTWLQSDHELWNALLECKKRFKQSPITLTPDFIRAVSSVDETFGHIVHQTLPTSAIQASLRNAKTPFRSEVRVLSALDRLIDAVCFRQSN